MSKPIENTEEMFPKLDSESVQDRRRFMKRTLSLTAVLAAAGLSESVLEAALMNDAEAADLKMQKRAVVSGPGSERDFANALSMAAHDGSSAKSLQKFAPRLSLQQQNVLKSLSRSDLNTLMALKRKLSGGNAKCCDAGATIF